MCTNYLSQSGKPLPTDPAILQARIDAISDGVDVERNIRDALFDYIAQHVDAEEYGKILEQAKTYATDCYAQMNAVYEAATGEYLFGDDPNPTGL